MKDKDSILLPGLDRQINFLSEKLDLSNYSVLLIGSGTAKISQLLLNKNNRISLIVDDYESLMSTKFELKNTTDIIPKLMNYESTDFNNDEFDLIYAQGSVSNLGRKRIVKEMTRICVKEGYLCIGEIVKLKPEIPQFVRDIFDRSNLDPLDRSELIKYYTDRNLNLTDSIDLSSTLKEYYEKNMDLLKTKIPKMNSSERSYYKKILNQISHQSNTYLKLGADKFIGFQALLLQNNKA